MKFACLALAASLTLANSASAQPKDAALDKLAADWTEAFARADVKALAALYTEDAVRLTPEGKSIGRAAIEKEFTANFAASWKGAKISIKPGTSRKAGADASVNEGTYEVSGTGPDGKPLSVKGNYVNTLVRHGGGWRIAGNTAIHPPLAPAK